MIRKIREDELSVLAALEKDLFPSDPWSEKEFLYEFNDNPFATLIVYEEDGKILGYADFWITYEQAQIADIAVVREAQKHGIGQKLMKWMISQAVKEGCENLTLEVRVSNAPAISLYQKNGFINAAVRKHYYEDGEDAYLMIKPLGGIEYDNDISA